MNSLSLLAASNAEAAISLQHALQIGLVWIGFGAVAGIAAQIISPGGEARPAVATILIGLLGAVVGPLAVDLIFEIENFHPISPIGLLSAIGVGVALMIALRATDFGVRTYVNMQDADKKRKKKRRDEYWEEEA